MRLSDYIERCEHTFTQAAQWQPIVVHSVQIAEVTFRLCFAGRALEFAIMPALAHLESVNISGPIVTLNLWDMATTGVAIPRPPFATDDYRRYGQRAVAYNDAISIMHAPTVPMLFAYNRDTRHGFFWTADAGELSIYERAAPLQTLLHWALSDFGWQIVHAAAVGSEQGGVLLIGNTGAGKSTTALSCLNTQNGLRLLSDDKCLARLDPSPQAFAAFSSGKIKADMLKHLPQFQDRLQGWDDSYKAGKGLVYLYPDYANRLIMTFAIKALVIPCVSCQKKATIRPIQAREAFRVFGPSTVIWLPGAEADNYRFTAELVKRLPCYQLDLALEPERNTEEIYNLIGKL
jgi:hypothetical protein